VATTTGINLPEYHQYQKGKNEAWRRLPRNLEFLYTVDPLQKKKLGKSLVTKNGQALRVIKPEESVQCCAYHWSDEFLYQFNQEIAYGLRTTLQGHVDWKDQLEAGKQGRYLLVVKSGHSVTLSESTELNHALRSIDIIIEAGATLNHYQIIHPKGKSFDHIHVVVEAGGCYEQLYAQYGSALYRRSQQIVLKGDGASCKISGACVVSSLQSLKEHVTIVHDAKNTHSEHSVASLLGHQAATDILSTVTIHSHAQKSVSRQKIEHLLLSEQARAFSKPALNVAIDDVDCQHGATMGMLDEMILFYMQSRGLDLGMAKSLYTKGFIKKTFERYEYGKLLTDFLFQQVDAIDG